MLKAAERPSGDRHGLRGVAGRVAVVVRDARDRLHLIVREGMKFGAVGSVALVVDAGVFNLLVHVGPDPVLEGRPVTGGVIGTTLAILVAWLGNRYWTFRHRRRSDIRREVVLFVLMNVISMGIAQGCLAFSRYVLDLSSPLADNIARSGVGLVLGMVFRFLTYRYVVFRGDLEERRAAKAAPGPGSPGPGSPADETIDLRTPAPQRTWTTSPALSDTRP